MARTVRRRDREKAMRMPQTCCSGNMVEKKNNGLPREDALTCSFPFDTKTQNRRDFRFLSNRPQSFLMDRICQDFVFVGTAGKRHCGLLLGQLLSKGVILHTITFLPHCRDLPVTVGFLIDHLHAIGHYCRCQETAE